ncbi:MAG: hypothetical protein QOD53_940, partial [Thermoleophilaceae bacterium]|nr:hypothetical protein [Thermoleophilaceae bacterium]
GAGGFEIDGAAAGDQAGYSVRSRTDFNGDGRPDVFVGANTAAPNGANSGASYVVYGFGTAIAYHPSSLDATVGVPIAPLAPSFERTGSASFSVSPALPDGLALDSATGVISGTPTRLQGRRDYAVTLTDEAGAAGATVSIAVLPKPGACANPQSGGPLADLLAGTAGGDRILGGGGKDTIRGLAGDDCLYGQAGNDKLFGDDGNDLLSGGSGKDRMSGGSGDDRLSGGSGKDRLSGGAGSDTLKGGKGADRIKGGPGKNKIDGGSGNDTIDSRNGVKEKVRCGKGRDTVRADRKDKLRGCERRRR